MNKTTMTISAIVLGLVALSGAAFAFGIGPLGFNSENREAIENAIETGDYEAWKEAMTNQFTEERFNKILEMRQKREAVNQALEAGDYEAWKEAVENLERPRITDVITEENFDTFLQLQEAKMNGDYETVKELSEQLGLGPCGYRMFGGRRMGWKMGGLIPLEGE